MSVTRPWTGDRAARGLRSKAEALVALLADDPCIERNCLTIGVWLPPASL